MVVMVPNHAIGSQKGRKMAWAPYLGSVLVLYTASGSSIHVGEVQGSGKAKTIIRILLDRPWSAFKINDITIERMTDGRQVKREGEERKSTYYS